MSFEVLEQFFFMRRVKNWFVRFERAVSFLSLVGGFVFDIFALKRIDQFLDNVWIGLHLLVAAVGIILLNLFEKKKDTSQKSVKTKSIIHFWLIILIQFAFGGLLSTFLVFYFRSATLATSWPFFILLGAAFVGNEAFKHHYSRLSYQISVFFLSLYSFAIYIVPVVLHRVGDDVFLLSGAVSISLLALFLAVLWILTREQFSNNHTLVWVIMGIVVVINGMYFTNIIPPIPLSLKDGGVYHSIVKNLDNTYSVEFEKSNWFDYFKNSETIHMVLGNPIYAYSAVFSPTNLNTRIYHVWQHYNEIQKEWQTIDRIKLPIVGGRDDGFRTYSSLSNILPGKYRVEVQTESGQVVGRIHFIMSLVLIDPQLISGIR